MERTGLRVLLVLSALFGATQLGGLTQTATSATGPIVSHPVARLDSRMPINHLPFTITSCGSYFLTGCLTGTEGITVDASDVTIDLNGFSLRGQPGSADGIRVAGPHENITIMGGHLADWGEDGVDLESARNTSVRDVAVRDCLGTGIRVHGGIVRGCVVSDCGIGIDGSSSLVLDCSLRRNSTAGIRGAASLVSGSVSNGNMGSGMELVGECRVAGNVSSTNDGPGITLTGGQNQVVDNLLFDNDQAGSIPRVAILSSSGGNLIVSNMSSGGDVFSFDLLDAHGPIANISAGGDLANVTEASHPKANLRQ